METHTCAGWPWHRENREFDYQLFSRQVQHKANFGQHRELIEKVHLDDLDLYVVMFTVLAMSV